MITVIISKLNRYLESIDDSWVLDFGVSFHVTPYRGSFIDYVQGDFGLVYLHTKLAYTVIVLNSFK